MAACNAKMSMFTAPELLFLFLLEKFVGMIKELHLEAYRDTSLLLTEGLGNRSEVLILARERFKITVRCPVADNPLRFA
jgi:hypothetical protein